MGLDLAHLQQWIGREEAREETLSPVPAQALAATLNRENEPCEAGTTLPALWHWLYFLPLAPLSQVGPDGHPERGGFLPPVPLARRMWAGSRLEFQAPLCLGETTTKRSRILRVDHKAGRAGDLVFVTLEHRYTAGAALRLREEQDIVYRDASPPGTPAPVPPPAPPDAAFSRTVLPDPVLLFRYSALTFNGHRIHYDAPYAREVEGYPGLVVHGPLIATLLLDALRHARPSARVAEFSFRALSPLFVDSAFTVNGAPGVPGQVRLWAADAAGRLAMEASARLVEE